jgi:hypothetical protein
MMMIQIDGGTFKTNERVNEQNWFIGVIKTDAERYKKSFQEGQSVQAFGQKM